MMVRRTFLKTTAMASAYFASPFIHIPKKKSSLGVALVGLGYYSTELLAPALQLTKHCHLAGIVTGSTDKAVKWQSKYNIPDKCIYNYDNMHTIADNDDIDVIYIVTPNALHLPHATTAANAGKHVWCEKPLAMNSMEGSQIVDACKKNGVKLSVGYRLQHEPNTRTIMGWSRTKPFGHIKTVYAEAGWRSNNAQGWKFQRELGGGAVYDMGTYSLNAARYTIGEDPINVVAKHIIDRPALFTEVDETTEFTLEFPSGALAHCKTSLGQHLRLLHVDCEKGNYSLEPFNEYTGVKGSASDGTLLASSIPNQQARQMDDDAWAIISDKEVLVPGEDGLADMRVIDGIFQSAQNDGKLIRL